MDQKGYPQLEPSPLAIRGITGSSVQLCDTVLDLVGRAIADEIWRGVANLELDGREVDGDGNKDAAAKDRAR